MKHEKTTIQTTNPGPGEIWDMAQNTLAQEDINREYWDSLSEDAQEAIRRTVVDILVTTISKIDTWLPASGIALKGGQMVEVKHYILFAEVDMERRIHAQTEVGPIEVV